MRSVEASAPKGAAIQDSAGAELADLYRGHAQALKAALRRRFGLEEAEDLVQEAFARIGRYTRAGAVRRPRALLLRIALNLASDRRRAALRAATLDPEAIATLSVNGAQAEALTLKQLILQLPKPLQDVFILSRFTGMTYPEIALQLGVSVKTVEWRMSKAIALCAARLRD